MTGRKLSKMIDEMQLSRQGENREDNLEIRDDTTHNKAIQQTHNYQVNHNIKML